MKRIAQFVAAGLLLSLPALATTGARQGVFFSAFAFLERLSSDLVAEDDLVDLWLELARDVIEHAKTTMIGTLAHRKIGRPIDQAEVANAEISTRVRSALH